METVRLSATDPFMSNVRSHGVLPWPSPWSPASRRAYLSSCTAAMTPCLSAVSGKDMHRIFVDVGEEARAAGNPLCIAPKGLSLGRQDDQWMESAGEDRGRSRRHAGAALDRASRGALRVSDLCQNVEKMTRCRHLSVLPVLVVRVCAGVRLRRRSGPSWGHSLRGARREDDVL